jgi:hypothetical protein
VGEAASALKNHLVGLFAGSGSDPSLKQMDHDVQGRNLYLVQSEVQQVAEPTIPSS